MVHTADAGLSPYHKQSAYLSGRADCLTVPHSARSDPSLKLVFCPVFRVMTLHLYCGHGIREPVFQVSVSSFIIDF